jgi:putative copper export protein
MFWLNVITRWLHVAAAVLGVGGLLFMLLVATPALQGLPNAAEVADALRRRFKIVAHTAIGLLLLTGFYNYLIVAAPKVETTTFRAQYHMLMGTKILLSLVLFTISILLLRPTPAMQANRRQWLTANALLGLLILLLAAYLRRLWA